MLPRLGRPSHVSRVIGTDVPVSFGGATQRGGRDRSSDLRRPAWNEAPLRFRASRYEAPEEASVSCAMRLQTLSSERRRAQQDAGGVVPRRAVEAAVNLCRGCKSRGLGSRPGKRKPERVRQDRRAVGLRVDKPANTGRSFARRKGGLAAMPAPFLLGPRRNRFPNQESHRRH